MDMYLRMYNDLKKGIDDNPTIGIILCTEKDETVVKYSVMSNFRCYNKYPSIVIFIILFRKFNFSKNDQRAILNLF